VSDDPDVLFYNPAGLATMTTSRGSAGFFKHLLDINSGHLVYGTSFEDIGHVAAGILFTNYGSFTEADESGTTGGTFSANDLAFVAGYATTLEENLTIGGSLKFIYSSIAGYRSTALAVDAGVRYALPNSRAALAASVRNLGAQLDSYDGAREDIPLDVAVGASVVPRGLPLLLNVGVHRLNDEGDTFADRFRAFTVGAEFTVSRYVALRVGYDNARRRDLKIGSTAGLAGFSAGLGIAVQTYRIDYALNSLGKIGNLHRITIGAEL
jgi:hypothetical protein